MFISMDGSVGTIIESELFVKLDKDSLVIVTLNLVFA